jgi:RHS repeat-associated protein
VKNEDGSVTFFDEDGSAHSFASAGGNNYTAPSGIHSKLVKNADDSFTLWFTDGSKYNFGSNGKINNITDKNDNHLNFTYNILGRLTRISDDSGLYLDINYNLRGRINSVVDPLGREIRYEYNVSDLTKVTDAMGNSTRYEYYDNHKLMTKVDRVDNMLTFSYYDDGKVKDVKVSKYGEKDVIPFTIYKLEYASNIADVTDTLGHKTKVEHNSNGNPVKITDPLSGATMMNWDDVMNQVSFSDANGHTANYEYDSYGNLIKEIYPTGEYRVYNYTNIDTGDKYISLLAGMNDSEGHFANFVYDSRGNLIMAVDQADNRILREYDEYGNMVSIAERGGAKTNLLYDIHGNNIKMIDPTGNVIEMTYDAVGRLIKITDASGNSTRYEYNKNDRFVAIYPSSGGEIMNKYDGIGRLTSITAQNGVRTDYSYEKGRKDITYAPDTGESIKVSLFYKKDGNIDRVEDPRDFNTTYEDDALGRVTSLTDALGNSEYYKYDAVGNFIQFEDKNGEIITYTYNSRSRLIQATDPQGHKTSYTYNLNGRVLTEENKDSKITYEYDYLDRLTNVTVVYGTFTKTLSYAYDADGNRIAMVDSDGGVTRYNYDKLGKLMNITDPHSGVTTFEYDNNGNIIMTKYPNNVTIKYTYDCEWQKTREIISKNEHVMYDYFYSYDSVGNVISVTESGNITHYTYDKLDRLVKVAYPSGEVTKYTYDKNGNRLKMINGSGTITYAYDEENRLLSDSTGATYTHDKNGNLIGKTDKNGTTSYFYDHENRLTKAVLPNGTDVEYKYFPTGYRMSKTVGTNTTYYFYDKGQVLMELDDDGLPIARYTHGSWVDEPLIISKGGILGYYLSDALGSIRAIVDADGNSLAEYEYDVFGGIKDVKDVVGLNNPYTFTGKRYDKETGLYYYWARYYCSELGRFLSRDPAYTIETSVKNSPYVYVDNNPATYTDPSGMCAGWCIAGIVVLVVGVATSIYGVVSAVQSLTNVRDKAHEWDKGRGRLFTSASEATTTNADIRRLGEELKDVLSDAAGAALALYTSLPGTLGGGGHIPTALPDVIAGGVYSYLAALVQAGYLENIKDFGKWKESLNYLNEKEKEGLKKAIEKGDKRRIAYFAGLVKRRSHPDDNYDVSTLSYSSSSASTFNYKSEEIAILTNGFYEEFSDILTELGESTTFVDVYTPLEDLNDYPILIIPSGGFSGISSLSSFKSKLENYVSDGGTLIVYSQNHGYEFDAVPGDLSGYGWTEDQACNS